MSKQTRPMRKQTHASGGVPALIRVLGLAMHMHAFDHCEMDVQLEGQMFGNHPLKLPLAGQQPSLEEVWAALAESELPMRSVERLHEGGYASRLGNRRATAVAYLTDANVSFDGVVLFENDFAGDLTTRVAALLRPMPSEHRHIHGKPVLSVARNGSGIGFHRHAESWLRQLTGSKVWLLAPPSARPPSMTRPCDLVSLPPPSTKRCLINPGEGMYVPAGWWHATCSSGRSIAAGWEGNASSWPEVWHAVADGDISSIRSDPNALDAKFASGETTLHLAARAGHDGIVENLLARNADPRVATSSGWEPMHLSAATGHLSTTQLLVGMRSVLSAATRDGWTALHCAARHGHQMVVSDLIARRSSLAAPSSDTSGDSALGLAMRMGHSSVVEMLLQSGSSPADAASVAGSLSRLDPDMLRVLELMGIQPAKTWRRLGFEAVGLSLVVLCVGQRIWSPRQPSPAKASSQNAEPKAVDGKKGVGAVSVGKRRSNKVA